MTDRIELTGKRILVTVGTTGIGLATVTQLVRHGARVLTFGRHQDSLDHALQQAGSGPGTVAGLVADAATTEGIDTVFAYMDETLGGIDMLVTSAALGAQPIHEMDEDSWRYVVETNLIGTLASARRAIMRMDAQGGGHLLFVGSITEIKAVGESVYAATKAGIQAPDHVEPLGRSVIDELRLVVPDAPSNADRDAILAGLIAFNRTHVEPGPTGSLAVLVKDADGSTVGGLWGTTLFEWLRIELLFVPERWRGSAVGSAILQEAEALAASRGCIGASLDTYSFQARGFYEKRGYSLVGTISECPPGGARHFLQKRFDPARETSREQ